MHQELWLIPPTVMILWLIGGQVNTSFRRYGLPALATIEAVIADIGKNKDKKRWSRDLLFLLYIPVLCVGYGSHSALEKWLKSDSMVRYFYALLCWIPILLCTIVGAITHVAHVLNWVICMAGLPLLIGVFQIRAGKLFSIGKFDVLIEDILRSLTIGFIIVGVLY